MATFNETGEPTSRKYVPKKGIVLSKRPKIFQTFMSQSSAFTLET